MLSGPAQRGFPGWMVGPLAHRLPALPDSPPMLADDLTRALAILGIAWLVAVLCAPRVPSPIVWTAVVATHVTLLMGPPLALTDVFNYLHYGRMPATYGVNPYASLPLTVPRIPPTTSPTGTTSPRPMGRSSPCSPRASRRSRCPPRTGRGRACCWRRRSAPSCSSPSPRAGSGARRRPRSRSSDSTRSSSSTASAGPTTSRWCCCAAWRRSRWPSPAGRRGPRRGGTSGPAPAPCWPRASSRRPPSSRPSWSWLAAGACLPWVAQAAPACCPCSSSRVLYGGHLPATSVQDGLVGPLSVPNVLAALAGHGGLTPHDRVISHAVLALAAVGATAAVTWRRAWLPGPPASSCSPPS